MKIPFDTRPHRPILSWRARRGWLRWLRRGEWDTGRVDVYDRPIRVCTRCGCSFVQPQCPSFICDTGWRPTVPARQPGQGPTDHPDAGKPVGWGEHPRDCDCGDCP